jgi:hypothetical protein
MHFFAYFDIFFAFLELFHSFYAKLGMLRHRWCGCKKAGHAGAVLGAL